MPVWLRCLCGSGAWKWRVTPVNFCRQVFRSNMSVKEAPKITNCKATDNWTCITFKPDLAKFGMEALEDDTMALMRRRVYDLAGILGKGVKVGGGRRGELWC